MNKKFLLIFFSFLLIFILSLFRVDLWFLPTIIRQGVVTNFIGSFWAGIFLALVLFSLNEFVFSINLTGEWEMIEIIQETSYQEYKGYTIHYIIHLLQDGNNLSGYGEKIKQYENNDTPTVFETEKRVRIAIDGRIDTKYISNTTVHLLVYENGRRRETTSVMKINGNSLHGSFTSTAAKSKGKVSLIKSSF